MENVRRKRRSHGLVRFLMFSVSLWILLHFGSAMAQKALAVEVSIPRQDLSANQQIEYLMQNPELPNGCEATSMAMVMRSYGVEEVNTVELAMEYVPRCSFSYVGNARYGQDPEECYVGDPSSSRGGWYCFEAPLIDGANRYLAERQSAFRAKSITGASPKELKEYAEKGEPVVVWITADYNPPCRNEKFTWLLPGGQEYVPYSNLHCVVLVKTENENCILADPLKGKVEISQELFFRLYDQMGKRAVVLE